MKDDLHYVLPPLERLDKGELFALIEAQRYFVMHAPRQTGKTTCMLALVKELNATGRYRAVYANIEAAQAVRENISSAMRVILSEVASRARFTFSDPFPAENFVRILEQTGTNALSNLLKEWSAADARPLVLVLDEIDALIGDTLLSVLRQLRSGYDDRPQGFPQSVILIGLRDVRDYRIHSSATKEIITGGSAFNIKVESLRLGNFSFDDIHRLYLQHTETTGQVFEEDIFPLVWEWTAGQPWLVNALAHQATWNIREMRDRTKPVTVAVMQRAKEELILRRDTHLDQLTDKLSEDRVRSVIQPLLAGDDELRNVPEAHIGYVRDLGLISLTKPVAIANGIYREIIPRELTYGTQEFMVQETAWYVAPDGRLDMQKLLATFQQFFREHAESWIERFEYKEAGPQLLLQAFLQRIVNGGGIITREYGLGRKRTDLLIVWPHGEQTQRIVLELKILRGTLETALPEALAQTADYADKCGAQEAHLLFFDRSSAKTWEEKIFQRTATHAEKSITVWGL
jgi:hypothetical protein